MKINNEWFYGSDIIADTVDGEIREQWVQDSLALGPHAEWVEPEIVRQVLKSGQSRQSSELVYDAMARAMWYRPERAVIMIAYLQGIVQEIPDALDRLPEEIAQRALEPLWARSKDKIRTAYLACPSERLFGVVRQAEPKFLVREIATNMVEEEAEANDVLEEWRRARKGIKPTQYDLRRLVSAYCLDDYDDLRPILLTMVTRSLR